MIQKRNDKEARQTQNEQNQEMDGQIYKANFLMKKHILQDKQTRLAFPFLLSKIRDSLVLPVWEMLMIWYGSPSDWERCEMGETINEARTYCLQCDSLRGWLERHCLGSWTRNSGSEFWLFGLFVLHLEKNV